MTMGKTLLHRIPFFTNMNMIKKFLCSSFTILFLFQILLLCSCSRKNEKYTAYSFDYFDTVTTIAGYAASREEFDRISGEILAELGEYHRLFTIYNRYEGMENLCTINERVNGAHRTVSVDSRIIDMLLFAKEMYDLTNGKVNIAMGSVLSIWHDCREDGKEDPLHAEIPHMEQLLQAAEHTDIHHMIIDTEKHTVTLTDPEMTLDVGAIAKGYAVEMTAKSLQSRGITGYMINVGGNVRTIGAKANGESWTVGIQNPDPESTDYLAYLNLTDLSLVTSGSYQRYYVANGKQYHHIIDPETWMPSDRYTSVSVLCESSALGDALSTALFCMNLEDGKKLISALDDVEAMWVTAQGKIEYSSGFPI